MPKLTSLSKDEFHAKAKTSRSTPKRMSKRELTHRRYVRSLQPYANGGFAEMTLKKGQSRQTEKTRLLRAGEELGLTLEFQRGKGKIRFEVKKK